MNRLRQRWQTLRSVARSLRIYYGDRGHRKAMRILYGRFIRRDDLVFDIGAHVGDRIAAFRRLGARVVAVEPQPALVTTLRILYGRDRAVTIEPIALASSPGTLQLQLNLDNPTVATGSHAFVQAAYGAPGWEGEKWTKTINVPAITLDALIERHGKPAFIKVDVEGAELLVLTGAGTILSLTPPPIWVLEVNAETSRAFGYHPRDLFAFLSARQEHRFRPRLSILSWKSSSGRSISRCWKRIFD